MSKNEVRSFKLDIAPSDEIMGQRAGTHLIELLEQGVPVALNAAVAPSQQASYAYITSPQMQKRVDWSKVIVFHMDDYHSLARGHPNTFEVGLRTDLLDKLPIPEENILLIKKVQEEMAGEGITTASAVAKEYGLRVGRVIQEVRKQGGIYVVHDGIGENGHMAFNDPHIDKWTTALYHAVEIDEACRKQQLRDYQNHPNPNARYATIDDVPKEAISATMALLLNADETICVVPGKQKAEAVKMAIEGPLDDKVAASFARMAGKFSLYLTEESASLLTHRPKPDYGK